METRSRRQERGTVLSSHTICSSHRSIMAPLHFYSMINLNRELLVGRWAANPPPELKEPDRNHFEESDGLEAMFENPSKQTRTTQQTSSSVFWYFLCHIFVPIFSSFPIFLSETVEKVSGRCQTVGALSIIHPPRISTLKYHPVHFYDNLEKELCWKCSALQFGSLFIWLKVFIERIWST